MSRHKPLGYVPNQKRVEAFLQHGQSPRAGRRPSPAYQSWTSMKARCLNKAHADYPMYGGRGITICASWLSFESFFADMGPREKGQSLERIDNSRGYEPENCRWASIIEQARNTRNNRPVIRSDGLSFGSMSEAAEKTGSSAHAIWHCCNGKQKTHHGFAWAYAEKSQ